MKVEGETVCETAPKEQVPGGANLSGKRTFTRQNSGECHQATQGVTLRTERSAK